VSSSPGGGEAGLRGNCRKGLQKSRSKEGGPVPLGKRRKSPLYALFRGEERRTGSLDGGKRSR